uniref:Uncharacterized protein n=1 Tax=Geospiza parvula TaxID=87175 RepID=A0A8C3M8F4_GEOPR
PIVLSQPTMVFRTQVWSWGEGEGNAAVSLHGVGVGTDSLRQTPLTWSEAPCRTMDSRTRTPAPTVTPSPMETLGPSCEDRGR